MGIESSSPLYKNKRSLGASPPKIVDMCTDLDKLLILIGDKTMELRDFSGECMTRELSLEPSTCAPCTGGWAVGFETGQITFFWNDLTPVRSLYAPGMTRAHSGRVCVIKDVQLRGDYSTTLVSYGSDGYICTWGDFESVCYRTKPKLPITKLVFSDLCAFILSGSKKIEVFDLQTQKSNIVSMKHSVKVISPIKQTGVALVGLEDGSICVVDFTGIVETLAFSGVKPVHSIVPLNIEHQVGMVTYAAANSDGKVSLRLLDKLSLEIANEPSKFCYSDFGIVVEHDGELSMFYISYLVSILTPYFPLNVYLSNNAIACSLMA